MGPIPKGTFLTKGVGRHREKLTSFELALRSAGIAEFNLVRVKSIFPPNCKLLSQQEGLKYLTPGQIVFAVMSDNATNEPHRLIASSVGVALPSNPAQYGYLSEHHSTGVDFDPNLSYDERKDLWRMSDKIVTTRNVTQSAIGDRDGLWSSVVAAAVFVDIPNGK
jgi:arginine decarboxylase